MVGEIAVEVSMTAEGKPVAWYLGIHGGVVSRKLPSVLPPDSTPVAAGASRCCMSVKFPIYGRINTARVVTDDARAAARGRLVWGFERQ
jgi:hypothetical protein